MAVTRADKETELGQLAGVFKGADAAILLDYKGINVPQVTQLRTEITSSGWSIRSPASARARGIC